MTFWFILRFLKSFELGFHLFHHVPDAIAFIKIFLVISLIALDFQVGEGGLEFMDPCRLWIELVELGVEGSFLSFESFQFLPQINGFELDEIGIPGSLVSIHLIVLGSQVFVSCLNLLDLGFENFELCERIADLLSLLNNRS